MLYNRYTNVHSNTNTIEKSKWNSKKCSSNTQKRREIGKKGDYKQKNKKIKW